ncbi:hypothetical protein [Paenibacillus massiliensis]|uniref:hypothetical protein n=1 Tax=Paenibacillus massiliensis TaxID=225917 RepID=UPI00036620A3|nr:hypothetical protein [Paenibacillus massiliensis]
MNDIWAESIIRATATVVAGIVVGALVKLRVHASKEEELFTNGPINILRKILFALALLAIFFAYILLVTSIPVNKIPIIYITISNLFFNWYTFSIVLILSILLLVVRTVFIKFVRKAYLKYSKLRRLMLNTFSLVPILLFLIYSLYAGFLINGLILESENIKASKIDNTFLAFLKFSLIEESIQRYLIVIIGIYTVIIFLLFRFMLFTIREKVTANIKLKDGTELFDKFILNYNLDNSILISNSEKRDGEGKILIPKANIAYINFQSIIYIFNQQNPGSGIVDPRYYDKSEETKLKEEFISKISKSL